MNVNPQKSVAGAIARVQERMAQAALAAGRRPEEVRLVAVSKTVDAATAKEALATGVIDLGESRVQQARLKFDVIGAAARWHMIGPLQTNKAKYCPGLFSLIHSIDRLDLMRELDRRAGLAGVTQEGLLQVNLAGEEQKGGCAPEKAEELLKEAGRLANLRIIGLMTIPPYYDDPERVRPLYRELAERKRELEKIGLERVSLREISAGMTGDFEIAIEEGATLVRVGSAIFGRRR